MKNIVLALLFVSIASVGFTQNWTTHNANNQRNGLTEMTGIQDLNNLLWTATDAAPTGLGMNIYSFGARFVTSRVDFSPYSAVIECRHIQEGTLIWTSPDLGPESILYAMGFNEDAVYAHDYFSNLFYALDPEDGSIKWVAEQPSYTFGPMDGVIYTCERNLVINGELGSVDASTICIDKENGKVLWTNANWISITPNESKAAFADHLYLITGAINQPKVLTAVDLRTGENLYSSEELPGDADQEGPIAVSPDGTIYFRRDGGDFFAVSDNGSSFEVLWTYTPMNMGFFVMNFGVEKDGNILIMDNEKIFRLDKKNGTVLDSSLVSGITAGRIAIGADSTVYVNDTEGKYYALGYDLQTVKWQMNMSGNYYAGPALLKDGFMIFCGSGNSIKAYFNPEDHQPVNDFRADNYKLEYSGTVNFWDQSSFEPTSWYWEFPGGTPEYSAEKDPQSIYYATPGVYEVTLITSNAYGSDTLTKECLIEVIFYINTPEDGSADGFSFYPNPASDWVRLSSKEETALWIYDGVGRLVYKDDTEKKDHVVDVSQFPEGIYFTWSVNENRTSRSKLIVHH